MGEGKPEASLSLSNAKYFSISLAQCAKSQNETTVNVGLIVDQKAKVSPEVSRLRNAQPDTKRNIDLCLNRRCESYTWEYNDDLGSPSWPGDRSGPYWGASNLTGRNSCEPE
jgi:hypothetical protein